MHTSLAAGPIPVDPPNLLPVARLDAMLMQPSSMCQSSRVQPRQQHCPAGRLCMAVHSRGPRLACRAAAGSGDRRLMVKLSLAQSSGSLDLSEFELESVPPKVFDLTQLEELTLAGNMLTQLPERMGGLTALRKLQISGNSLSQLPESIGNLIRLEGLWVHGNLLTSLPDSIGALSSLKILSAVGNQLTVLPESIGGLHSLTSLELAGNSLSHLPEAIGSLGALEKLQLHGNKLRELPCSIRGLSRLKSLSVQGNMLRSLPDELTCLKNIEELLAADNELKHLPDGLWQALPNLQIALLYGNLLTSLPAGCLSSSSLKELWAEANPLPRSEVVGILQQVSTIDDRKISLGLDSSQLAGTTSAQKAATGQHLRPGDIIGQGQGYFKLSHGREGDVISADGTTGDRVLAVAFGSAPGVPNWGGLLARVSKAAQEAAHECFDVLFVVDPGRSWYSGGDEGFQYWWDRLAAVTGRYSRVLMLGDSMGATAALAFSPLATAVHAFTPQVDLRTASLRPGRDSAWLDALSQRVMTNVAASEAHITVHSSSWQHDLDQARLLPTDKVQLKLYGVTTHRLAYYLASTEQLLPIVRGALLQEMGFSAGNIRLQNLV